MEVCETQDMCVETKKLENELEQNLEDLNSDKALEQFETLSKLIEEEKKRTTAEAETKEGLQKHLIRIFGVSVARLSSIFAIMGFLGKADETYALLGL